MYVVTLSPAAQRQLDRLDRPIRLRILAHLRSLADNARPSGAMKLEGQDAYRIRVGDYRIVYTIEDGARIIWVIRVAHRREVYR